MTELLTYDELRELSERDDPSEELQIKLHKLLTTPFVSNQPTANGTTPLKPNSNSLGRFIRIAHWNIERGLEYEALESAFTNPSKFVSLLDQARFSPGSARRKIVLDQLMLLKEADIIVLNEVDWGMKRTGYRNVAADLAAAMKMNYSYGAEFIEVDPIALGSEDFDGVDESKRAALCDQIKIEPAWTGTG